MPRNRHIRNPKGCCRTDPQIYPRKPTLHEAIKYARSLGLSAYRTPGIREVRIADKGNGASYFSDDPLDIINTAWFMAGEWLPT